MTYFQADKDFFGNVFCAPLAPEPSLEALKELGDRLLEDSKNKTHTCMVISSKNTAWTEAVSKLGFEFWFVNAKREACMGSNPEKMVPIGTCSPGVNVLLIRKNPTTQELECLQVEEINRKGRVKNVTGCVEREHTSLETVAKEVFEETGYKTSKIHPLFWQERVGLGRCGTTDIVFYYVAFVENQDQDPVPQPEEISFAAWIPLNKIMTTDKVDDRVVSAISKRVTPIYSSMDLTRASATMEEDWLPTKKTILTCRF